MLIDKKPHPEPKIADSTECVPIFFSWIIDDLPIEVSDKMQIKYEALNSGKEEHRSYLQTTEDDFAIL